MSEIYGIAEAVEEALELYAATHQATADELRKARHDFWKFYLAAMAARLKGIRWNFNGCILCAPESAAAPVLAQRILLVHPKVIVATAGRALGTIVCERHSGLVDGPQADVVDAALRRIRHHPPRRERSVSDHVVGRSQASDQPGSEEV